MFSPGRLSLILISSCLFFMLIFSHVINISIELFNGNYKRQLQSGNNCWTRTDVTRKVWELNTNLNCLSDLIITGNYVRQLDTVKNQKKVVRVRCFPPLYFKEKMFLQFNCNFFYWGGFIYTFIAYISC